jgi:hypothetical protein
MGNSGLGFDVEMAAHRLIVRENVVIEQSALY